jgi:hypothetical protein
MLDKSGEQNMAVKAFIPPPIGDQDHIIRRLGWAVVRHWSSLPGDVQADVYQQALSVQDKNTVQFEELARFIEKHMMRAGAEKKN